MTRKENIKANISKLKMFKESIKLKSRECTVVWHVRVNGRKLSEPSRQTPYWDVTNDQFEIISKPYCRLYIVIDSAHLIIQKPKQHKKSWSRNSNQNKVTTPVIITWKLIYSYMCVAEHVKNKGDITNIEISGLLSMLNWLFFLYYFSSASASSYSSSLFFLLFCFLFSSSSLSSSSSWYSSPSFYFFSSIE